MDLQTLLDSTSSPRNSKGAENARLFQPMPNVAEPPYQTESISNMPPYFSTNQVLDLTPSPAVGSTLPTQTAPAPSHAPHPSLPSKNANEDDHLGDGHLIRASHLSSTNAGFFKIYPAVPLPAPQPTAQVSKYNPTPVQMADMKRRTECLPPVTRCHPNLVVSRGHEELRPPLKKIYRADVDLFFNVFAKWAFKVDVDAEAPKRMYDVLSRFQTQLDFAHRSPVPAPIGHAAQNGLDLGRMIVRRAFQIKQGWMVPAISHLFITSQMKAEQALNTMVEEDFVAYTEWGPASWMDSQLREKFFFEFANRSLKGHFLEMKEKTKGLAAGAMVDIGDDVDRGEDYNDGQGRILTDKEVTEISYYMDFIFIKTGGNSLGT